MQLAWQQIQRRFYDSRVGLPCDFSVESVEDRRCPIVVTGSSGTVGAKNSDPVPPLTWREFPSTGCVDRCGGDTIGILALAFVGDRAAVTGVPAPGNPRYTCRTYYGSVKAEWEWGVAVGFAWPNSPRSAGEIASEQIPPCL